MSDLTAERLREVLHYDPQTGVFTWRQRLNKHTVIGETAGSSGGDPYIRIGIDGVVYRAHRLAWLYMTGEWPRHTVDHHNLNKRDNRWDNLRPATRSQNQHNRGLNRNNTSGHKGVCFHPNRGKWTAAIWLNGVSRFLGYFPSREEAAAAYAKAANDLHGEFARIS